MKKRVFAIVMVMVMLFSFTLSACKTDKGQTDGVKVGFIYIGPVNDGGWTQAHDDGRKMLEQELGVTTIYKENVPEDDAAVEQEIRILIDQGCTIIITTSFGFMDATKKMADQFPNVTFLHCSGWELSANHGNYFGRIYEPRFLSGLVAGLKTKTNKVGYVAAMQIPEVVRGINAFTLGVQAVNPDAEVHVRWTNTWIDPVKAKDAAVVLIQEGCDVITQHQDSPGPQIAAQDAGVFAIGYDLATPEVAPDAYMTAPVFHWGYYYVDTVKAIMDGNWQPSSYWKGLESGIVDLAPLTNVAPPESVDLVAEYREKIIDGSFFVFQGEIMDRQGNVKVKAGEKLSDGEMLGMMWFVAGVKGTLDAEQ
ncbi:MAG: BMP family ABC transporter substrate-binding protein [Clostridia bacterium]